MEEKEGKFIGLIPFILFIIIYLGTGLYFEYIGKEKAFYQLPSPVAITIGIISAFIIFKGDIDEKFSTFVKGCGNSDIVIMCIIYLLAGAFGVVTKSMGGVESTANLGLTYISPKYITAGVFLITSFISTATGTSVGSIVAIAPVGISIAEKAQISLPLMLAAIMGGAMFGDDLSMISDTTISATRTQGCMMKDKFLANVMIALPSALLTFILFILFGKAPEVIVSKSYPYEIIKIIPYIFVLLLSLAKVNVFVVLTGGILLSGIIGVYYNSFDLIQYTQKIYEGFLSMGDIFLLSFFTGGLATMVSKAGGIDWIVSKVSKVIKGKKSAEFGIGMLVMLTDFAVANNTVAIIINGSIAKKIAENYKLDKRRVAGLLGIFSCIGQGIIPYGAQMLFLLNYAGGKVSALEVIPILWYQQLLGVFTIISIFIPFYKKILDKSNSSNKKFDNGS